MAGTGGGAAGIGMKSLQAKQGADMKFSGHPDILATGHKPCSICIQSHLPATSRQKTVLTFQTTARLGHPRM